MVPNKFLYLRYLEMVFIGPRKESPPCYDFFSLVFFLDASPALETFVLHVSHCLLLCLKASYSERLKALAQT
jgi:hypothetical protein